VVEEGLLLGVKVSEEPSLYFELLVLLRNRPLLLRTRRCRALLLHALAPLTLRTSLRWYGT
jgi:hypothetical protein